MFPYFIPILMLSFSSLNHNDAESYSSVYHLRLLAERERRAAEVLQKMDNPDDIIIR